MTLVDQISKLQHYMENMKEFHVDDQEYAYLKAMCLFSVDFSGVSLKKQLERCWEKSLEELTSYVHDGDHCTK